MRLSQPARETAFRIASAVLVTLMLSGVVSHAQRIPMLDPCDICHQLYPDWVCWLQLCF